MKLEDWVKILYTYGPFAILVLLVFVTRPALQRQLKEATRGESKTVKVVYILNWIAIFGMVIFSVYAWKRANLDTRPQIKGTIENLSNTETLGTTSADLYLHKIRKSNSLSDFEWLLVNKDKRFPDGAKIRFTIQVPKPDSLDDDLYEYELPIRSDYYENDVLLRHREGKLFLDRDGQETELHGGILPGNTQPKVSMIEPTFEFSSVAYAQTASVSQAPFSTADFQAGLESPDAIIRRKARADLANQDSSVTLPWIDSVLNGKSSYRLRLGVIVALNSIPNLTVNMLMPSTIDALQIAVGDSDDTIRNEAVRLLNRFSLVPAILYEHINYSGKYQAYAAGKYRADKKQLGSLPNDSASSVRVAKGFRLRICDSEGNGNGSGACETYTAGWRQLKSPGLADKVSFIEVTKSK